MATDKKTFVFHKFYDVSIDPAGVDETDYADDKARDLMTRMVQAIITDKTALQALLEYQVLLQAGLDRDDGNSEIYIESQYGREMSFGDFLVQIAGCFREDDRQWLLTREKEYHEMHKRFKQTQAALPRGERLSDEDYRRIGYFEQDDYEPIANCFKVEPGGWNMNEIPSHKE